MSSENMMKLGERGYVIFVKDFRNEKKIYFLKQKKDLSSGQNVLTNSGISLTLDEWASLKTAISAVDRELEKISSREESRRESQSKDQFQTQSRHTAARQKPTSSESFQTLQQLNGNAQNYEEEGKGYLPRTFTTSELNSIFQALGPEMQMTGEQEGLAVQYQLPSWGSEAY